MREMCARLSPASSYLYAVFHFSLRNHFYVQINHNNLFLLCFLWLPQIACRKSPCPSLPIRFYDLIIVHAKSSLHSAQLRRMRASDGARTRALVIPYEKVRNPKTERMAGFRGPRDVLTLNLLEIVFSCFCLIAGLYWSKYQITSARSLGALGERTKENWISTPEAERNPMISTVMRQKENGARSGRPSAVRTNARACRRFVVLCLNRRRMLLEHRSLCLRKPQDLLGKRVRPSLPPSRSLSPLYRFHIYRLGSS